MIPLKPLPDEENQLRQNNAKGDKISEDFTLLDDQGANDQSVALNELSRGISVPQEASEASGYKACLSSAGNFCRAIQCCCAACGSGPIKTIEEGHVGLRLEFGKLKSVLKPGLHSFNPCTEKIVTVDMRINTLAVGMQTLLTKDSLTVFIEAYINYSVIDPVKAKYMVQDYQNLIGYFARGALKNVVAQHTLNEILTNRQQVEAKLTGMIDRQTIAYGLKVFSIETQKIQLPSSMDRAMAISAETQRQAEAKIIEAQGNLRSASLFRQSADELSKNDLSIQLHYFDTLKMIAAQNNSTIIVPDSILSSLKKQRTGAPKS